MSTDQPRHFLRNWRQHRDLTLEQVAERIGLLAEELPPDPTAVVKSMTHATLSRIERGIIPYSQPLLEILAHIYQTDPPSLIMRDPLRTNAPWSLQDVLIRNEGLSEEQAKFVTQMVQGLKPTGTGGS